MLQQQQYISEKLREVDAARRRTTPLFLSEKQPAPHRRGPIGPIARVAGRALHRTGAALEEWAT